MNERRIALGLVAWFLGIIVPVYHHVALHAAIAHQSTNNDIARMQSVFEYLPWIDWAYLLLMFAVGAAMIVSGSGVLANRASQRAEAAGPRSFEVIPTSESGHGR